MSTSNGQEIRGTLMVERQRGDFTRALEPSREAECHER